MNQLQIFKDSEFGEVRTVTINNEPYFVGSDVARALGFCDAGRAVRTHVEEEDRLIRPTPTEGGVQNVSFINESGMYALVFGSKLESAKRFKKWVTSEVLPSIRKSGSYNKPLTALEQLNLHNQAIVEVNEKVEDVRKELHEFKDDLPLLAIEIDKITRAKNHKVVPLLGGKLAPAYKNKSLRTKVYKDIESQLWRQFGVKSYKEIKRNQSDVALQIIDCYVLPYVLQQEVETENAQMCFA